MGPPRGEPWYSTAGSKPKCLKVGSHACNCQKNSPTDILVPGCPGRRKRSSRVRKPTEVSTGETHRSRGYHRTLDMESAVGPP